MCLWNHPGQDLTGMVARCRKVAKTMEELLGGEVYHYHTKLMMKEAHTGGSFVWHQDYGQVGEYTKIVNAMHSQDTPALFILVCCGLRSEQFEIIFPHGL